MSLFTVILSFCSWPTFPTTVNQESVRDRPCLRFLFLVGLGLWSPPRAPSLRILLPIAGCAHLQGLHLVDHTFQNLFDRLRTLINIHRAGDAGARCSLVATLIESWSVWVSRRIGLGNIYTTVVLGRYEP